MLHFKCTCEYFTVFLWEYKGNIEYVLSFATIEGIKPGGELFVYPLIQTLICKQRFWVFSSSMDENTAPPVPYLNLYSDGTVHDAHPAKVVSSCNLDIYNFPFDVQNCSLTFNSYLHSGKTLPLYFFNTHIMLALAKLHHKTKIIPGSVTGLGSGLRKPNETPGIITEDISK